MISSWSIMTKVPAGTSWVTPEHLWSGIGHRSWEFLLDSGSCSWWPHLSCSWPLPLYFAANASAVKVMMTHYPPRVRHDAGTRPLFLRSVAHPHPTPLSLSLNIFLALCAPLSFTVSRRMSWFQGLMSEHLPRLPVQSTSHGEGKLVWVGHFPLSPKKNWFLHP